MFEYYRKWRVSWLNGGGRLQEHASLKDFVYFFPDPNKTKTCWLPLFLLIPGVAVPLWGPFLFAFLCYLRNTVSSAGALLHLCELHGQCRSTVYYSTEGKMFFPNYFLRDAAIVGVTEQLRLEGKPGDCLSCIGVFFCANRNSGQEMAKYQPPNLCFRWVSKF